MSTTEDNSHKIKQRANNIIIASFRSMDRKMENTLRDLVESRMISFRHRILREDAIKEVEELCVEELVNRAHFIWKSYKRVISEFGNVGTSPEDIKAEIKALLKAYQIQLNTLLSKVAKTVHFTKTPNVDEGLEEASRILDAEIDLFFDTVGQSALPRSNGMSIVKESAPNFAILSSDVRLVEILEERWREAQYCVEEKLHVAAIIMMGSLLEGVLYAKIKLEWGTAKQSSMAPRDKAVNVIKLSKWSFEKMIDVAYECQWIKKHAVDFGSTLHVLRDYRNIVHPRKHLKSGSKPDVDTCAMAWPVVRAAIKDLIKSCGVP